MSYKAVLSPCIGICELDAQGLCRGCHRTVQEIAAWSTLGDDARLHLMSTVLPQREHAAAIVARAQPADPLVRIVRALHPLGCPPLAPAWNADEIADLIDDRAPRVPAAVLIALIERAHGHHVLFTRRTHTLRRHAGEVSFPGGRVDPGDRCDVSAALREAEEEVGLPGSAVQPLGFLDPYDTISAFRILPVVARVDAEAVLRPQPAEVSEAFEVPLAFLLDPGNCERVEGEFRGRVRHWFQFRHGGHRIWGATAAILVNLRMRLAEVE